MREELILEILSAIIQGLDVDLKKRAKEIEALPLGSSKWRQKIEDRLEVNRFASAVDQQFITKMSEQMRKNHYDPRGQTTQNN